MVAKASTLCAVLGSTALTACVDVEQNLLDDRAASTPAGEARPASVAYDGDVGWAWAHSPTTASYAPDPRWTFNNSGGGITAFRDAVGRYRVVFAGLTSARGNAHAVGWGANPDRCKVQGWSASLTAVTVNVICHGPDGLESDTPFVVYYAETLSGEGAYLWASIPWMSHVAQFYYAYNSSGQPNHVTRQSVGVYLVRLAGLDYPGGHALVTAYGTDPTHCKPVNWYAQAGDTLVAVSCFDTAGARADSRFTLRYVTDEIGPYRLGYAWLDRPQTPSYTPDPAYSFNSEGGANEALRAETGRYLDTFRELPNTEMLALVSSYDDDANYCKLRVWTGSDSNIAVQTDCRTAAGVPADGRHSVFAIAEE